MVKTNRGIIVKTGQEISKMVEGGKKLAEIKKKLAKSVAEGVSAIEIENLADKLIKGSGGVSSFKMVPGYSWATCVNVNQGIVHGIPKKQTIFKKGDLVSIDVGLYYKGFHTDTSISVAISPDSDLIRFLTTGKSALKLAISNAKAGNYIYDISSAIEEIIRKGGYSPVKALVGHGVGKELHENPQIPCFKLERREESIEIPAGAVLAIEVMYSKGSGDLELEEDGWTIVTSDDTISGLFEETVAVTSNGPQVLTD